MAAIRGRVFVCTTLATMRLVAWRSRVELQKRRASDWPDVARLGHQWHHGWSVGHFLLQENPTKSSRCDLDNLASHRSL
ncbi:hypothetical protein IWZ03DRAFT_366452 [Phyllosticta citriasiana]|uniref:Secreted protein n=1 Tax=Phyllosticta citriasiana TaxID=595635 RepID=A0ABR1KZA3_9PEZI